MSQRWQGSPLHLGQHERLVAMSAIDLGSIVVRLLMGDLEQEEIAVDLPARPATHSLHEETLRLFCPTTSQSRRCGCRLACLCMTPSAEIHAVCSTSGSATLHPAFARGEVSMGEAACDRVCNSKTSEPSTSGAPNSWRMSSRAPD